MTTTLHCQDCKTAKDTERLRNDDGRTTCSKCGVTGYGPRWYDPKAAAR